MTPIKDFLEKKPLYYDEIDYGRMPRIYNTVKSHFKLPKIIHIVGTNAKGSTGRYLSNALHVKGLKVGHYTSPHILNFNERIWIDGCDVDNEILEKNHKKLFALLTKTYADELSYFEYTTLLAMLCFEECEYVVLEAGLGGEYDATNVFDKVLSIFTPIDIDHQAFLGNTIESIATTKMNSMQSRALISVQEHLEVYDVFERIARKKNTEIFRVSDLVDDNDLEIIFNFPEIPVYMQENMLSAMSALKLLDISYDKKSFQNAPLFGRLTKIAPNIILDVGHNILAAKAIVEHLKGQKFHLIYNSYADKDYREILKILKPIIECVELITIDSIRGEDVKQLEIVLDEEGILHQKFFLCKDNIEYLIFGSFSVAEAFLNMKSNSNS